MLTIEEIRRANLLLLIAEAGTAAKLSAITGVAEAYISQVKRGVIHSSGTKPRAVGDVQARRLEAKMGKAKGWMDKDHSAVDAVSELSGREGQLIGLFRLLSNLEQADLLNTLTRQLRRPPDAQAVAEGPGVRH